MEIIAIIPARGGSKRIPGKNIKPLQGIPLIHYTLKAADSSHSVDQLFVSTEDRAIKEQVEAFSRHASKPLTILDRPLSLAKDNTTTEDVLIDAIKVLKKQGINPDFVILLPPTTPFRAALHIDALVALVKRRKAGSGQTISKRKLRTGTLFDDHFSYDPQSLPIAMDKLAPRYVENSAAYIFKPEVLLKTGKMQAEDNVGLLLERPHDLDINDPLDWMLAECVLKEGMVNFQE
ncbi:MAG: acylneuraminate cytidylyltransferase family protein [Nanoarchaeota archaeon]